MFAGSTGMGQSRAVIGGLAIMRERAQLLGGHLTITSTPDHGTEVEVVVPALASGRPTSRNAIRAARTAVQPH